MGQALRLLGKLLGEHGSGKPNSSPIKRVLHKVSDWDQPVIYLQGRDHLTLKELQFVHVLGTTGSGKTTFAENIASIYLTQGFGGLVLTDKQDELATWQHYARKYGREDDLIVFTPGEHGFNFLDYAHDLFSKATGSSVIQNVADLLQEIAASKELRTGSAAAESFWTDGFNLMVLNALYLLSLSRTEITLTELQQIILSAPDDATMAASEEWRTNSRCFSYIAFITAQLDESTRTEDLQLTAREILDFERVVDFWLQEWAALSPNTRSCIQFMFANIAQGFSYGVMADSFCGQTTITPDLCRQGKIIVLNMPIERWQKAGQYAQITFKLLWQKTMKIIRGLPVFLWVDEASGFVDKSDSAFLQTARSHQCCYVLMSQTLALYFNQLPEKMIKALIENFNIRIFLASGDPDTNRYAAECISKGLITRYGMSVAGATNAETNHSSNETVDYKVAPECFTRLKMGGPLNGFLVGSYIMRVGRPFLGTGDTFIQQDWPQHVRYKGKE